MADPNLIQFIAQSRAQGYPDDAIRQSLLQSGWPNEAVDEALGISANESLGNVNGQQATVHARPRISRTTATIALSRKTMLITGGIAAVLVVVALILLVIPSPEAEMLEIEQSCLSADFTCQDIRITPKSIEVDFVSKDDMTLSGVASAKCRGTAKYTTGSEFLEVEEAEIKAGVGFTILLENCNNGAVGDPFNTVLSFNAKTGTYSAVIDGQVKQ